MHRSITLVRLCLVMLVISLTAQAQKKLAINGLVWSGGPIGAADCFLKHNEYIGTITDVNGAFHLSFSTTLSYDTLVILAMGFERRENPIAAIAALQDTVRFLLEPKPVILDEIVVEAQGQSLRDRFLAAIANVRVNYPDRRHQLTGLYRRLSTRNAVFTRMEEAAILVEDYNYRQTSPSVKIAVQHFRETRDRRSDSDSLRIAEADRMHMSISRRLLKVVNPLTRLYEANVVRHYNEENSWFNLERTKRIIDDHYSFDLMNVSFLGGDTIFQIGFAANPKAPPPDHVSGRNYLIINSKDNAIVEMQLTLGYEDEPLWCQTQVKFARKNRRYYPTFIRTIDRNIDGAAAQEEYDIRMFFFDTPVTEDLKRIKTKELVDPDNLRGHKNIVYSQEFWDTTVLLRKFPLDVHVMEDLKKQATLDSLFH